MLTIDQMISVIPCTKPGLTCCEHRMVRPNCQHDKCDNVARTIVWCSKWRLNRARDGAYYGCQKVYETGERE